MDPINQPQTPSPGVGTGIPPQSGGPISTHGIPPTSSVSTPPTIYPGQVQTPPPFEPGVRTVSSNSSHGFLKTLIAWILFIVFCAVLGLGTYGYLYGFVKPEVATLKALNKISNKVSYTLDTRSIVKGVGSDTPLVDANIVNTFDFSNPNTPATRFEVRAEAYGFIVDGEFVSINKKAFIKLKQAPFIGMFVDPKAMGKWIDISPEKISEAFGQMVATSTLDTVEETISKPKIEKALIGLMNYDVIEFGDSKVIFEDTKLVRKYNFKVNKEKLVNYLEDYAFKTDPNANVSDIRSSFADFTFENSYLSIDLIKGDITDLYTSMTLSEPSPTGTKTFFVELLTNFDFVSTSNVITEPLNAITLKEVLPKSLLSLNDKANEAKVRSLLSTSVVYGETYYENQKSYSGFCENDPSLKSNLDEIGNTKSKATCKSNQTNFMISAQISENNYLCVDNIRSITKLTKTPTGFECK